MSTQPEAHYVDRVSFLRTGVPELDGAPLFAIDFDHWPGAAQLYADHRAGIEPGPVMLTVDYGVVDDGPAVQFTFNWPEPGVAITFVVPAVDHIAEDALRRAAIRGELALTSTAVFDALPDEQDDLPLDPENRAVMVYNTPLDTITAFLDDYRR